MKKVLISIVLVCLLSTFFIPIFANAIGNPTGGKPLVTCSGADCTIEKFFEMIGRIYNFIVWDIATPLATLALLIGGVMLLISAGNPELLQLGKKILWATAWGLVLVFGAWLIVNTILVALTGHGIQ